MQNNETYNINTDTFEGVITDIVEDLATSEAAAAKSNERAAGIKQEMMDSGVDVVRMINGKAYTVKVYPSSYSEIS